MSDTHPLRALDSLVLIAIGGFAGANLRYLFGLALPGPGGTLLANALGSLALGFVLSEVIHVGLLTDRSRLVVATGFLSSFTTYSTFAVQTVALDSPAATVGNVVATYALGFAGVLVGGALARLIGRRSA